MVDGMSGIIGNRALIESLMRIARSPGLGHAYLFFGPEGVGKKRAGLAFARAVNCTCRSASELCESCLLMESLNHPELLLLEDANKPRWFQRSRISLLLDPTGENGSAVYENVVSTLLEEGYLEEPLPRVDVDFGIDGFNIVTNHLFGKGSVPSRECYTPKPVSDMIRKQLDEGAISGSEFALLKLLYEYPLSVIPYRGAIPIAYVAPRQGWKFTRPVQAFLSMRTMSGGKKVVIIDDAHKMTPEAQNCLLKTLEEPPPDSLLILVTSRKELLFETIISRCQVVGFSRLSRLEIEDAAAALIGQGSEHRSLLMTLSENCPGRLLELGLTGIGGLIDSVRSLFDDIAAGRLAAVFAFSRRVLDEGGSHRRKTRLAVRRALELVIFWIIETMRVQHGRRPEIEGSEFAAALKAHMHRFDEASLLAASRHLETSLGMVNLNVDMSLFLQATLLRTARILQPDQ